jgi:hypothetical protein
MTCLESESDCGAKCSTKRLNTGPKAQRSHQMEVVSKKVETCKSFVRVMLENQLSVCFYDILFSSGVSNFENFEKIYKGWSFP